ncbi:MAG: dienelactone hydrolase family protein [Alphaproteobacteria bacterium]|nr:dienelactone hydrolase family protein [Alphaproteobacteria bacterium]
MSSLHYVNFPSLHERPLTIAARLRVPEGGAARHPAVVILHGSAGPSGREGGYARVLGEAGFATLEPDQWAPRKLAGGAQGRPRTVEETLGDVFGAKKFLSEHPQIDSTRIGLMGFSFGGIATLLATTRENGEIFAPHTAFAAYMACYPVCWLYGSQRGFELKNLVTAPIFILTAAQDEYDNDPRAGEVLIESLDKADRASITTRAMADCHHGFDMPGVDILAEDPFANRGEGGKVTMRYNPHATTEAHRLAVEFFSAALRSH